MTCHPERPFWSYSVRGGRTLDRPPGQSRVPWTFSRCPHPQTVFTHSPFITAPLLSFSDPTLDSSPSSLPGRLVLVCSGTGPGVGDCTPRHGECTTPSLHARVGSPRGVRREGQTSPQRCVRPSRQERVLSNPVCHPRGIYEGSTKDLDEGHGPTQGSPFRSSSFFLCLFFGPGGLGRNRTRFRGGHILVADTSRCQEQGHDPDTE